MESTLTSVQLESQCKTHWRRLGIRSVEDLKANIKGIFEVETDQMDVLIRLYRLVFPDWDRITKIHGYPSAGTDLWRYVAELFMEFDRKHHPGLMPGGAWMNTGFSSNKKIDPWGVGFSGCTADVALEPASRSTA